MHFTHTPGLMFSSAAAISFEAGKLCESTTRASPPGVWNVGAIASILKVYWIGDRTAGPPTAARSCANDFGSSAGKMYSSSVGSFEKRARVQAEVLR
jgi:hypothetical protein